MVNLRHTDNVSSRGWYAKSAKGRTFSIPPKPVVVSGGGVVTEEAMHYLFILNDPPYGYVTYAGSAP
jgi:hypothetical protein